METASPIHASDAYARLVEGTPALLVVAHPDDETIGLGGHLAELPNLVLLHVTSGAPRDPEFARAAGFDSTERYAEARARELDRALELARVARWRRRCMDVPDQAAPEHLVEIARAIGALLRDVGAHLVLTHAYEGGHPDHDAVAFAARAAARGSEPSPIVIEMPFYHRAGGAFRANELLPLAGARDHEVPLSRERLARKRAMLACFASQSRVIASLDATVERFRVAPEHDFTRPPHEGSLHYESLGWPMTGSRFREHAARAQRVLALERTWTDR